jgi:hypothetical protein
MRKTNKLLFGSVQVSSILFKAHVGRAVHVQAVWVSVLLVPHIESDTVLSVMFFRKWEKYLISKLISFLSEFLLQSPHKLNINYKLANLRS